jgi:aminopeptidase N
MNGTASTDDLRRAMEQVSGQDLSWFFHQWLNRSGVPSLAGEWHYDAAAKQVVVTVRQTQEADPFRLAIGVGVVSSAGVLPRVQTVEVNGREATVKIGAETEPASVILDPTVAVLAAFGTFAKAQPSVGR